MAYYCASSAVDPDHTIFLVGQSVDGQHYVTENHGLIGGTFVNRAEAIRFARDESDAIAGSVVLVTPEIIPANRFAIRSEAGR